MAAQHKNINCFKSGEVPSSSLAAEAQNFDAVIGAAAHSFHRWL
jgi:hypothetical protein